MRKYLLHRIIPFEVTDDITQAGIFHNGPAIAMHPHEDAVLRRRPDSAAAVGTQCADMPSGKSGTSFHAQSGSSTNPQAPAAVHRQRSHPQSRQTVVECLETNTVEAV